MTPLQPDLGEFEAILRSRFVVSFSLFGDSPRYCNGAIETAEAYGELFPGWTVAIFYDDSVPATLIERLVNQANCTPLRITNPWVRLHGTLWRFIPACMATTDVVLVRDLDSRPSTRERAAVDDWLASGHPVHIMRDHAYHTQPILAGMCGFRKGILAEVGLPDVRKPEADWGVDQRYLADVVYPAFASRALVHQDWRLHRDRPGVEVRRFPTDRTAGTFVGQGFEADGSIRQGHEDVWPGPASRYDAP